MICCLIFFVENYLFIYSFVIVCFFCYFFEKGKKKKIYMIEKLVLTLLSSLSVMPFNETKGKQNFNLSTNTWPVIFLKSLDLETSTVQMTLKYRSKVKFNTWFGGFRYMFGVVYYSMLWPRTSISVRNFTCHPILGYFKSSKFHITKLVNAIAIILLSALGKVLVALFQ